MNLRFSSISNWVGFSGIYYTLFPILCDSSYSNQSISIELFADKDYSGHNENITNIAFNDCVSLEGFPLIDKQMSSLRVNQEGPDFCVNLYKIHNCSGEFVTLDEGILTNMELWGNSFNDAVSSLGPCPSSCLPPQLQKPSGQQFKVDLYEHEDFKGSNSPIQLTEGVCSQIPIKLKSKASSIKVHYSSRPYCIQIFEQWNCTGTSSKMTQDSRIPPANFARWPEMNDKAKSISFCGYSCNRSESNNVEINRPAMLGRPSVVLYSEFGFVGLRTNVTLSKSCHDIIDDWQGQAYSIDPHKTCIHLYDNLNCTGRNLTISEAEADLERVGFKELLRSLRVCENVTVFEDNITDQSPLALIIYICSGLAILAIVVIVTACCVKQKFRRHPRNIILTEYDIQEFFEGSENAFNSPLHSQQDQQLALYCDAYDRKYEIDFVNLEIDTTSALGYGQFGIVFRGKLRQSGDSAEITSVAVKTLKPYADVDYVRALLREIKVMIHVGKHSNILELIGCCTANLDECKLYVVTRICGTGNLEKYLRKHKESFVDLVTSGELALIQSTKPDPALINKGISTVNLLKWSVEIAKGMAYLEEKKVIHGDMAARNVLLDENLSAKISDFGLSKKLYEYSQYVKKKDVPLPWRWLAIESMKIFEFSTKSDVWAYGVTMWEIFSLGDVPYPGRNFNDAFILELESGYRLPKPKFAPNECHTIMLSCWQDDPESRPTFNQVIAQLEEPFSFLTSSNRYYMG